MHPVVLVPPPPSPERCRAVVGRYVLVIDDDRTWLAVLGSLLEAEGFVVLTATNAPAALRVLAETSFDLIVSDLAMPRMDGLELRDAMLAQGSGRAIPFILMSSVRTKEAVAAAYSLGVPHFVEKGAPIEDLLKLARCLAG